MTGRRFIAAFALALLSSSTWAYTIFESTWPEPENSFRVDFGFDDDTNPISQNIINDTNPYGTATCTIDVGSATSSYGWYNSRISTGDVTGYWYLSSAGSMSIDINASAMPAGWDTTYLVIQIPYFQLGYYNYLANPDDNPNQQKPEILIEGATLQNSTLEAGASIFLGNAWVLYTTSWVIEPSVNEISITVNASDDTLSIDRIVVDAYSVPEPSSIAILLGGLVLAGWKRQKNN